MNNKKAFTLAEVLITLAIIGIVAALTIPNLIVSYKRQKLETDLKYSYSILQNLVKYTSIDYGEPQTWNITNDDSLVFENYFINYLKSVYKCSRNEINADNARKSGRCQTEVADFDGSSGQRYTRKYILSNGIAIMYQFGGTLTLSQRRGTFLVDVGRGDELVYGKTVFPFNLIVLENGYFVTSKMDYPTYPKNFCDSTAINTPNDKLSLCSNSTPLHYGFARGILCTAMIECNNWKIPDDYPIKF